MDWEAKAKQLERDNKSLREQLSKVTTENHEHKIAARVRELCPLYGVVETGMIDDAVMGGYSHLTVDERGQIVTRDGSKYGAGLGIEAWFKDFKSERPHWNVQEPKKENGKGPQPRIPVDESNPWSRKGWNLTSQGRIWKERGESVARQMAAAAGVDVHAHEPAK